jgi:hypothetical protein
VCYPSKSTPRSLEIRPFWSRVGVFPGQVSSFPSSNGSGRGALDSSGPTTLKRISHVVVGRKSRNPFCRIVCRMVHFFVVGGYPLVSGLTPAAESFSSPGLLEDSAHWTIAELCRNSSTPCEVGPRLKGSLPTSFGVANDTPPLARECASFLFVFRVFFCSRTLTPPQATNQDAN